MIDSILEHYQDQDLLKADGFDDAVIGVSEDFNSPPRLIYSVKKCIEILMKEMSYEDAVEHFNFNVSGAYVGEQTPVWCHDDYE